MGRRYDILCLSALRADHNLPQPEEGANEQALPQCTPCGSQPWILADLSYNKRFASVHSVRITTANVHKAPRADLWNAL